ncbi:hypothetical protein WG66_005749, partial [Moniliophthora roreri]
MLSFHGQPIHYKLHNPAQNPAFPLEQPKPKQFNKSKRHRTPMFQAKRHSRSLNYSLNFDFFFFVGCRVPAPAFTAILVLILQVLFTPRIASLEAKCKGKSRSKRLIH